MREHDRFTDMPLPTAVAASTTTNPSTAPPGARPAGPADLAELDGRAGTDLDGPPTGDRWSTWDGAAARPAARARAG